MGDEIRFCPNCGSTDVEPDSSNAAFMAVGGNPNTWKCNECDYTGMMPHRSPEGDPDEDQGEKEHEVEFEQNEDYSREDTGFGKAYLKYVVYIALPLLTFYFLIQIL